MKLRSNKRIMKEDAYLKQLIIDLKKLSNKEAVPFWRRIASDLAKPTRQRILVNVSKIGSFVNDGQIAVVPGKVLGNGDITKGVTVAAYSFSKAAVEKIKNAKGKCITIQELMKENPKAKNCKIIA